MFTTRIKSAFGTALAIGVTCVIGISSQPAVQGAPARPLYQCQKESKHGPIDNVQNNMVPDGVGHDFGKVKRGTLPTHSFRVVNTSDVPIRIASIRASMSSSLRVDVSANLIQPNQEGAIVIFFDTRNFVNTKTVTLYVTVEIAGRLQTLRFWVTANSVE